MERIDHLPKGSAFGPDCSGPRCPVSCPGDSHSQGAAFSFQGFTFAYPSGKQPVVGPVNWSVPRGSFALLVGNTGSGKTTLLRQLKPELAPVGQRTGHLQVSGQDPAQWSVGTSAQTVGYVAQNPENQAICSSVWHELAFGLENLGTPQDVMRRRIAEVAHFFGIEPWLNRDTSALSGGQKQIMNLASVLTMRPQLLVLDEPTAQLDPVAEQNFLHALFRTNRETGITVVVATHKPEVMAPYATCAYRMEDGCPSPIDLGEFRYRPLKIEGGEEQADASAAHFQRSHADRRRPHSDQEGSRADCRHPRSNRKRSEEAIRLKDVFVSYPGEKTFVLRGTDLSVEAGSLHALVGGNGSGKTTLLKTIAGILKPKRGKALNTLGSCQGYLPQDPKVLLVKDSIGEELEEWSVLDKARPWLELLGLAESLDRHPYDLSGGQQQLLALAKVLACEPQLLLLDEPTKGLDPVAKLKVAEALQEARDKGTTIVMSTHDLAFTLTLADRVSMMFDGQAACTETPREFFGQNLFYKPMACGFTDLWSER